MKEWKENRNVKRNIKEKEREKKIYSPCCLLMRKTKRKFKKKIKI